MRASLSPLNIISRAARALLAALLACSAAACHHVDDDRIPPVPVRVSFNTIGDWHAYGVAGVGVPRIFSKADMLPPGFPYPALSYTGFGGVMLIGDIHGNPVAYDLACPVEVKASVRVQYVEDDMTAECPVCHSVYELVTNYGNPIAGPAAQRGYALRRYSVVPGLEGEYMVITR